MKGSGKALVSFEEGGHPNDALITGFSDGILRFVAQRGAANKQLEYVERIDQAKKLRKPLSHKSNNNKKKQEEEEEMVVEKKKEEEEEERKGKGKLRNKWLFQCAVGSLSWCSF